MESFISNDAFKNISDTHVRHTGGLAYLEHITGVSAFELVELLQTGGVDGVELLQTAGVDVDEDTEDVDEDTEDVDDDVDEDEETDVDDGVGVSFEFQQEALRMDALVKEIDNVFDDLCGDDEWEE